MLKQFKNVTDPGHERHMDLKGIHDHIAYMKDEMRTYPDKKEAISFVFHHNLLWDTYWDARDMAVDQALYLLDEATLAQTDYLKLKYVASGIDMSFYLDPVKCRKNLGDAATDELIQLEDMDYLLFLEDGGLEISKAFKRSRELMTAAIQEHGFENVAYTYADLINQDGPVDTTLAIFQDEHMWSAMLPYFQTLLPIIPDGTLDFECQRLVEDELERLVLSLDTSHALKTRYLKNMRYIDQEWSVGTTHEIKMKRKQLRTLAPQVFKNLKK